ncbi:MAG: cobyric acid synthase [Lachnospiraceae bacterium]|nr:cobyric acid synthase [Lachnospiraceae bacterium]
MARKLMIQGTMSSVGKSLLTTGLLRVLKRRGIAAAPFKSQNMSNIAHVTADGLQFSRAQAIQAEAAGCTPLPQMNPILLKPCGDMCSELIVLGESRGKMRAMEYFKKKTEMKPLILKALHELEESFDAIVIEGAGSPAEINLKQNDIVNMGMAEMADCDVLLAADIDRGGVFAQIYGTLALLEEQERARVKGVIINKFRGDIKLLLPGITQIEELTGVPVYGVLPYLKVDIEEEDSLKDTVNPKTERSASDAAYRNEQFELLADAMEENLQIESILSLIR